MKSNNLVLVLFALGVCQIHHLKAFQCGFKNQPSDNLRNVLSQCLKGDQTLDKLLEMGNDLPEINPADDSNEEDDEPSKGFDSNSSSKQVKSTSNNNWSSKFSTTTNSRFRRAAVNDSSLMRHRRMPLNRDELIKITGKNYPSIASTTDRSSSSAPSATEENDNSSTDDEADNNVQDGVEGGENKNLCALKCVFDKLELVDSNGLPDHGKFLNELLQTVTSRDLRNFLQKSSDECFQQMEEDDSQDPCKYSIKLVSCLAKKGRQDCSDWPSTGPLPL